MRAAAIWIPAFAGMTILAGCSNGSETVQRSEALRSIPNYSARNNPTTDRPTIVSLNPCTDAILAEISSPGQVLALSHYSRDPSGSSMDIARAREFGVTGGTVEEVLALDPDMVVGSTFMAPATRAALDGLGIRVETIGIAQSVADSVAQIRELARVSGRERGGEELVAKIRRAMEETAAPEGSASIPAVLWQPGGIVPGESALVSQLMEHTGFSSHSASRGLRQADYLSLERLLSDPPELLLVAGQERSQRHPALAALPQMHSAGFDPALLYCGGPTIIRVLERLAGLKAGL